jgi:hypothetical protein
LRTFKIVVGKINEHDIGDAITTAQALGRRLIRLLDDRGRTAATYTNEQVPAGFAARQAWAAHLTAAEGPNHPYLTVFRWQCWTGRHWADLALPIRSSTSNDSQETAE